MKYKIELNKKAQKFIKSQPRNQQERILKAVSKLPDGDVKALSGNSNAYRLRVGNYRVIYEINNDILLITIVDVGNRVVPLDRELIQECLKWNHFGINPGIIDDHFKKCRKNSELPYFKFHSLRHYFASELHAQGIPDKYIAEIGGWENVETLQRIYQHTLKDHADELTKKILNVFAYSNSKNKSDCNSKSEKQA